MPFSQRIYDTSLGEFVYYTKQEITAAPLAIETSPNHTNNLDAATHTVIAEVPDLEVATLADLRDLPLSISGHTSVRVRNYAVDGDGGGGLFHWLDYETTDDDDGVYILPTGHVGNGRWVREGHLGSEYNALWWGMASVGDTDCSALFQQAIDSSIGKTLRIPINPLGNPAISYRYRVDNLIPREDMYIKAEKDVTFYANVKNNAAKGIFYITNPPLADTPQDGETVTIDGKVYTFQVSLINADGNVQISADLDRNTKARESIENLIAAINLDAGAGSKYAALMTVHPTVTAVRGGGDSIEVTAKSVGVGGNSIATTTTVADGNWEAATLEGGGSTFQPCWVQPQDDGPSNMTIEGGTWDRFKPFYLQPQYMELTASDRVSFKNMTVRGGGGDEIGFDLALYVNYYFFNVTFNQLLYGVYMSGRRPANQANGHHNITNFDQCRWIGMKSYGIYKLDTDRDAAVLRVHNCSAEGGDGGWMKVGGTMQNLVVEGMYIEFNGKVIDEPDIIIDASNYFIRNCTLRNLYFSVQGANQTEKLHLIGRVNPIISDCMFNLSITGAAEGPPPAPTTSAIYLNLYQPGQINAGAYLINNYILDLYEAGENYRDRLYRLEPGMNEAAVVVQECTMSNQDLMPGLELPLGTVTANDVEVLLYKDVTADYGSPETINTFSGGVLGQRLHIRFTTANTTIAHAAGGAGQIHLKGGVNLTPAVDDIMVLYHNGTDWYEEISPALAPRYITGGADEIDGDQLDIDFTPTTYTPDTTPAEATNVDHLTAHLAGIDNELESIRDTNTIQTVNATPTTIYTFPTVTNQGLVIEATAQGRDTVNNDMAYYKIVAFYENVGGVVAQKDVTVIALDEDDNAWNYTLTISGTNVLFNVVGDAVNPVNWKFTGTYSSYG